MPTPRAHGGAQLTQINLPAPGFGGLNTEQEGSILGVEWATTLDNAVFDSVGRPATRKGWLALTSVADSNNIKRIFEYYRADEVSESERSAPNGAPQRTEHSISTITARP